VSHGLKINSAFNLDAVVASSLAMVSICIQFFTGISGFHWHLWPTKRLIRKATPDRNHTAVFLV
jgi:hypothetical protein